MACCAVFPAFDAGPSNRFSRKTDLMSLIVIALLGGVFTVLSPCILPVVPFVFARSDRPFITDRLPLLIGLAGTFGPRNDTYKRHAYAGIVRLVNPSARREIPQ